MFCTNCGKKVEDNAFFCVSCGAKLVRDEPAENVHMEAKESTVKKGIPQKVGKDIPIQSAPAEEVTINIEELLSENISECPAVKKVADTPKGVKLKGKVLDYFMGRTPGKVRVASMPAFPFSLIVFGIPGMLFCNLAANIGWELAESGYFELTDHTLLIALGLLALGIVVAVYPFIGRKEKKEVLAYIRKTLEPRGMVVESNIARMKASVRMAVSAVMVLAGILVLAFPMMENIFSGHGSSADDYLISAEDSQPVTANTGGEVALSETYTNEEEGFSFRYPSSWCHLSESDFEARNEMLGGCLISEIYSSDDIGDTDGGESYFASYMQVAKKPLNSTFQGTIDDFQQSLSLVMDEVNVFELQDIELNGIPFRKLSYSFNDQGKIYIVTEYYYVIGSDMYVVRFCTLEKNVDKYNSVFQSIIDSYMVMNKASADLGMEIGIPEIGYSYDVPDESIRQSLLDWFERHPFLNNAKVQFVEQTADTGAEDAYYLFELYFEGEKYGFIGIDKNTHYIVMDSAVDYYGDIVPVQILMDQWYLEYYWGWTDDSGYYSESYGNGSYGIYDEEGNVILEYHEDSDSYAICDYDGRCYIEYDDGSPESEVSIMDFAGMYAYDAAIESEEVFGDYYYSLEVGIWDGYFFSIFETWRGNEIIGEEYARPVSLVLDTLTFEVFDSYGGGYEKHSLTYIPAENSPTGRDVIYLDGDDTMPFVRE